MSAAQETPHRLRLPNDAHLAPGNSAGVYRFSWRFPSDYELGLTNPTPDLLQIRELLVYTLDQYQRISLGNPLSGLISTNGVRNHLRRTFEIEAASKPMLTEWLPSALKNPAPALNTLKAFSGVLRKALDGSCAVYVGITEKQSIRGRLDQHLSGNTGLLERLKKSKLSFSQIWFEYTEIDVFDAGMLREIELLTQHLTLPSFSKA